MKSHDDIDLFRWQVAGELLQTPLHESGVRPYHDWLVLLSTLPPQATWKDLLTKWHTPAPSEAQNFEQMLEHVQNTLESLKNRQFDLMREYQEAVANVAYLPLTYWQKAVAFQERDDLKSWYTLRQEHTTRMPTWQTFETDLAMVKARFEQTDTKVDRLAQAFAHITRMYRWSKKDQYQHTQNVQLHQEIDSLLDTLQPVVMEHPELVHAMDGWLELRFWMPAPQWEKWDVLWRVIAQMSPSLSEQDTWPPLTSHLWREALSKERWNART